MDWFQQEDFFFKKMIFMIFVRVEDTISEPILDPKNGAPGKKKNGGL